MISGLIFKDKNGQTNKKMSLKDAKKWIKSKQHAWIDVVDASNEELKGILKTIFPKYYSLILEDCIENTKPKVDLYDDFIFTVFKAYPDGKFNNSQVNIIVGKDYIISIRKNDINFEPIYSFFEKKPKKVDFVLYKILSSIFDMHYRVLDKEEDAIDKFEELAIKNPKPELLRKMLNLKKKLLAFHRTSLHEREVLGLLARGDVPYIKKETCVFLKDVYDDVIHVLDTNERVKDSLSSAIDIYLSSVSNKTNEIMKALTIVASFVLIPTLITGIYGMNFREMVPIWTNPHGFLISLMLMLTSIVVIYVYFKKEGFDLMGKKFKFLEHSADVYIESYGKTLEEAFQNAAIGLGFLIIESDDVEPKIKRTIEVKSEDKQALVFDFLTKILYYQDAESLIFHDVKVEQIENKDGTLHLSATATGEEFDPEKHTQGTHVKAITYHHMEIEETKDKYRIKVLVDI